MYRRNVRRYAATAKVAAPRRLLLKIRQRLAHISLRLPRPYQLGMGRPPGIWSHPVQRGTVNALWQDTRPEAWGNDSD